MRYPGREFHRFSEHFECIFLSSLALTIIITLRRRALETEDGWARLSERSFCSFIPPPRFIPRHVTPVDVLSRRGNWVQVFSAPVAVILTSQIFRRSHIGVYRPSLSMHM